MATGSPPVAAAAAFDSPTTTLTDFIVELRHQFADLLKAAANAAKSSLKHPFVRFATQPDKLLALGVIVVTAFLLPILGMFVWRYLDRRRQAQEGYHPINDAQQIVQSGRFDKLDELGVKARPKKPQKQTKKYDVVGKSDDEQSIHTPGQSPLASPETPKKTAEPNKTKDNKKEKPTRPDLHEFDETRIQPDFNNFELDEAAQKELANMELHGKLKAATVRARVEKITESMTSEERAEENRQKMAQLEAIYKLMEKEGSKFGMDKADLMDQMRLYTN